MHQLDVVPELSVPPPAPAALRIARATGEALDGGRRSAPAGDDDSAAVLALWRHPGG